MWTFTFTKNWLFHNISKLSNSSNSIDRRQIIFSFINIVMIMTTFVCVLCLFLAPYLFNTHIPPKDLIKLLILGFILISFHCLILWINQTKTNLAVLLFLIVFNTLLMSGDTTFELIEGRSCIYFIIPIVIVSLLYPPLGGIFYTIITIFSLSILSFYTGGSPNIPGSWAYFFTAVIVSYSAYILDKSLHNIQKVNVDLSLAQAEIIKHNLDLEAKITARTQELEKANADLALALVREKEFSTIDYLTGIFNRRVFFEMAQKEFAIAKRYQKDFCIILFDIDHFKQINDNYGHIIGDLAIKHVVEITRRELRNSDIFGRYGGEEFIILLPHTLLEKAIMIAERIREHISCTPFKIEGLDYIITVSMGVSSQPFSFNNIEKMIEVADHSMYKAKTLGRNRVYS